MAADGKKDQAALAVLEKRPAFPFEVEYLWHWFGQLTYGLAANGTAPVMASWRDVLDWEEAAELVLEPWERSALVKLSYTRAMVQSEQRAEEIKAVRNGPARAT